MNIIGITGLPSSGKGEFSKVASDFGFHEIIMGDVIRKEVKARGLKMTRENSNQIMLQLREERGQDVVAVVTLEWIKQAINDGKDQILIDGIRSMNEVNLFKEIYPELKIIAIHADPMTRYLRSKNRRRKDDAYSLSSFQKRDKIELQVGIGNVIALADILIPSPSTLEEARSIYREVLHEIETEESKKIGVVNGC